MKKELKQLIKDKKLSDEQILTLLTSALAASTESDKDVIDEDESEEPADSKEQDKAEKQSASKETAKPELKMTDLAKLIAETVSAAFKAEKEANLLPAQKPLKPAPKPKPQKELDLGLSVGEFNLVG